MTFSSWTPREQFMQQMTERALRFAPHKRIEPTLDAEAGERRRPPLLHDFDKPVEQLLAEEMDYYSVPL